MKKDYIYYLPTLNIHVHRNKLTNEFHELSLDKPLLEELEDIDSIYDLYSRPLKLDETKLEKVLTYCNGEWK